MDDIYNQHPRMRRFNCKIIDAFCEAKKVEGRADSTVRRYRRQLVLMFEDTMTVATATTTQDIRSYLSSCMEHGCNKRTLNGKIAIYRTFFDWMADEGIIDTSPMRRISSTKVGRRVYDTFTDEDLGEMMDAAPDARARAIMMLLLSSGMRASELVSLDRGSLDFDNLETVVRGKGDKDRVVLFDRQAADAVREYLAERDDDCDALFVTSNAKEPHRLGRYRVEDIIRLIGRSVGVHAYPHKFRRTCATRLSRDGMPVQDIQLLLGHEDISTTQLYVVTESDQMRASYRAAVDGRRGHPE